MSRTQISPRSSPSYFEDESGQWWYRWQDGGIRTRCVIKICEGCRMPYPVQKAKAEASRFCSRTCSCKDVGGRSYLRAEKSPHWQGGRRMERGYVKIYMPAHPSMQGRSRAARYVFEHRVVMEQKLGRYLLPTEHVHHLNGVKDDNRPENLELWHKHHPPGQRVADPHCPTCTCGREDVA